ncbi:pheromone A receptor-domain-containing protein [Annulohypoxylon moriforme]|nr:pheromone A receptor-domain-containing protein [Annulohypoxylon moriforme]
MSHITIKAVVITTAFLALLTAVAMAAPVQVDASPNDQRFAPNPSLTANLAFRVILAIIGTALCWVPFRLLWRNGDFAAVVLIIDVALMNLITVLNSLIWNSDNWDNWWIGTGLCDIEVYLWMPLQTIYAGAILAIIRQLAQSVKLAPVSQLTRQERKSRVLAQAAIIFPAAFIQLVFTWFDIVQRYNIGTLIGCMVSFDNSWPQFIVYDAPPTVYVVASVPYAVLTWKRFRAISRSTLQALKSNETATARATWIRNRLYAMSLAILVVYLPVSLYLTVENFLHMGNLKPYSYTRIHWGENPYPWDAILFVPSWLLSTVEMNQPWIAISTTIVIVGFFGTTKDGLDMYRRYAAALRLSRCLPRPTMPRINPEIIVQGNNHPEYARSSWIEMVNQPSRRMDRNRPDPIDTTRTRRIDAFYAPQDSETTTGPSTSKTPHEPLLSLPLPPRCVTSPSTSFPPPRSTTTSPLDSNVISMLIPPRSSSLAYQHEYPPRTIGPTAPLPRIPPPKPMPHADPADRITLTRLRQRSASTHSDQIPILTQPSLSPIHRALSVETESDSPTTVTSQLSYLNLRHARSRDAVQLSSVLESESFHRPTSIGSTTGPLYASASGALTSSTASAIRARDIADASGTTSVARSSEDGYVRVVIAGSNPLIQGQSRVQSPSQGRGYVSRSESRGQGQGQSQGVRSPCRQYNMGALRGRGISAPRSVDEVKAEGVRCTEFYDSDYSDA